MCLPTCARPDCPPCYKVPCSLSSPAQHESYSNPTSESKVHDATYLCQECDLLSDAFEDSRDEDTYVSHDQATLRREKSRVAAKLRRQKENQALVKLRLALPIHSSKFSTGTAKDLAHPQDTHRPTACASSQSHHNHHHHHQHTKSRVLTECDLSCIPNYRAANSISRQHHLAAPEFEKAVTVRLAGNALCLYDWLYAAPTQLGPTTTDYPNPSCTCCYTSRIYPPPSLSLFSQSLIAIVVDTTENTVVYAPPSYAQLIGISWNTIIGLRLYEVRFKQFSSSISSQLINTQLSRTRVTDETAPTLQSTSDRSCRSPPTPQQQHEATSPIPSSPDPVTNSSATDSGTMSTDPSSPKSRNRTRKALSGSKRLSRCSFQLLHQPAFYAELWQRTEPDAASSPLTTLLPPGPNAAQLLGHLLDDGCEQTSGVCVTENGDQLSTSAIRQSLSEGFEMFAVCWATMTLPAHAPWSYMTTKTTRHGLTSKQRSDASGPPTASSALRVCLLNPITLRSGTQDSAFETSCGLLRTNGDPYRSTGPRALTNMGFAPQTYHSSDDLTFLNAQSQFLSALDYTHEKIVGCSLLDFIHPDDLQTFSMAIGLINETHPVITSFYRIRTGSGLHRWSRLIGMLCRRSADQSCVTPHRLPISTKDCLHASIPNFDPTATSDDSAHSSWIVCWHQFAQFDCTGDSDGLSTAQRDSKELPIPLSNRFSRSNLRTCYSDQCAFDHQDRFPSPECSPHRSATSSTNPVCTDPVKVDENLGLCCTACRIPRRCSACGTINSFSSDTSSARNASDSISYIPLGQPQTQTSGSPNLLPSVRSITANHDILCSLTNLSTYGENGDVDTWDMDGVIPAEDALLDYCPRRMSDSTEPAFLHQDADRTSLPSASNQGFRFDESRRTELRGDNKALLIQSIKESKVDWARQAPSINPDFGEVEIPGDSLTFCTSYRTESSAPSSTDADSFVLTPNFDLELSSSVPLQPSGVSGFSWTADDVAPGVPRGGTSTPSRLLNYSDAHVDSHHSFLLPQAEICAVPSGYRTLMPIDHFNDLPNECMAKRKRYAIESLDDPIYSSPITTVVPHLSTELERLSDYRGSYQTTEIGTDSVVHSSEFGFIATASCKSNPCRSSLLDLDSKSVETFLSRPFYHRSTGLPTLRRLLNNQVAGANFSTSSQVIRP